MEGDAQFLNALEVEWVNGFGFQSSSDQNPPRLYIGQIFLRLPADNDVWTSQSVDTAKVIQDEVIPLLPPDFSKSDVWCTDFIGREFVTVRVSRYRFIPDVINAVLSIGKYGFKTHNGNTSYTAVFAPGESYTRDMHELRLVETLRENFRWVCEATKGVEQMAWVRMKEMGGLRSFLKEDNWITPQGKDWCRHARQLLAKAPTSKHVHRYTWDWFREVNSRYNGIFFAVVETAKKQKLEGASGEEGEDVCMICLDRQPSTLAIPCGCRVVCDSCSHGLCETPDNRVCVRCRKAITHVAYQDANHVEEK